MTTEHIPTQVEKNAEHAKVGEKAPANSTIVKPVDNQAKIRQEQIDAMKSYRLTNDGQQSFSLKMENGAVIKDARKLGSHKTEQPGHKTHEDTKRAVPDGTNHTKAPESTSTRGPEELMHKLGNMAQNTLTSWNQALQNGFKQEKSAAQGAVRSGTEAFRRGQKMLEHGVEDAQHAAQGAAKAGSEALHQGQKFINHELNQGQKTVQGLAKQSGDVLHEGQKFISHEVTEGQKAAQHLIKQGGEALHEGQKFINHEVHDGQKTAQQIAAAIKPYTDVIEKELQQSNAPLSESLQTIQHAFQRLGEAMKGKDQLAILAAIPTLEGTAESTFWRSLNESGLRAAMDPHFYQNAGEVLKTVFADAPANAFGEIFTSLAQISDWGAQHKHQAKLLIQSLTGNEAAKEELNDWREKNPVSAKQMVDSLGKLTALAANFHPIGFAANVVSACGRMAFGNEIETILNRNPSDRESMAKADEAHKALEEIIGPAVLGACINAAGARAATAEKATSQASQDIAHSVPAASEVPASEVPPAEAVLPQIHEPASTIPATKAATEHPIAAPVQPVETAPPPTAVSPAEAAPPPNSAQGHGSEPGTVENKAKSGSDQGSGTHHAHSKSAEAMEKVHHHLHQYHKASELTGAASKSKETLTPTPVASDADDDKPDAKSSANTKHKE